MADAIESALAAAVAQRDRLRDMLGVVERHLEGDPKAGNPGMVLAGVKQALAALDAALSD